jgi:hypothetical protein
MAKQDKDAVERLRVQISNLRNGSGASAHELEAIAEALARQAPERVSGDATPGWFQDEEARRSSTPPTPNKAGQPSDKADMLAKLTFAECASCRGPGTTESGSSCPDCRGEGTLPEWDYVNE